MKIEPLGFTRDDVIGALCDMYENEEDVLDGVDVDAFVDGVIANIEQDDVLWHEMWSAGYGYIRDCIRECI